MTPEILPKRKDIRLKNYDYKKNGYYFVTICTKNKMALFSYRISQKFDSIDVAAGSWPAINKRNTDIVEEKLLFTEKKFPVEVDFYCIMSDHIHIIFNLQTRQGRAATRLAWIVNAFKGWCTRSFGKQIFQPNYYEHVIRNERALLKIREYIYNNPLIEDINLKQFYSTPTRKAKEVT
ncbi:transposase [bacterium]|nr:transposase [bacterium]